MGRRLRWWAAVRGRVGVRAFSEFGAFGAYEHLGLAGLRRWWTFGAWAASAVGRRGGVRSGLPAERHGHAVYYEAREDLGDDGHPALAHDEAREVVLARRAHLPRREERAAVEALRAWGHQIR